MKKLLPILLLIFSCEEVLESIKEGCTTTTACNYDATAMKDDGSCVSPQGCNEWCEGVAHIIYVALELDCKDVCGGLAAIDSCGVCSGGTTGLEINYLMDCAGTCNGDAVADNCGTCDSDNTNDCDADCNGDYGGTSVLDECGVCDTDSTNNCVKDCYGVWGGTATGCTVYDIDGNGYTTVTIGTQEWLVQNLKVTHYKDGQPIATGFSNDDWAILEYGAYAVYDDDPSNAEIYGNLYNWFAVDDDRGVCPEGFHVPSDDEWIILMDFLGGEEVAGGKLKEEGTEHWKSPNTGATNESGFTGLPAGYRTDGYFGQRYNGSFWSSAMVNINSIYPEIFRMLHSTSTSDHYQTQKTFGASIRCLGD